MKEFIGNISIDVTEMHREYLISKNTRSLVMELLPRYCFFNKKDNIAFEITKEITGVANKGELNEKQCIELTFSITHPELKEYKDNRFKPIITIVINQLINMSDPTYDAVMVVETIEKTSVTRRLKRSIFHWLDSFMWYLQGFDAAPDSNTIITKDYVPMWIVQVFNKCFAIFGTPKNEEDNSPFHVYPTRAVYVSDPTNQKAVIQQFIGVPGVENIKFCQLMRYVFFGDFSGCEDGETIKPLLLAVHPQGEFHKEYINELGSFKGIYNFLKETDLVHGNSWNSSKCFDMFKKHKIGVVWPVTNDDMFDFMIAGRIESLILHEISTNPKFTTSNLIL